MHRTARLVHHGVIDMNSPFTLLTALYQFLALGVRLYFPAGFAALVGVSIWFARQRR